MFNASSQNIIKYSLTFLSALLVPILTYYVIDQIEKRQNRNKNLGYEKLKKLLPNEDLKKLNSYEFEIGCAINDQPVTTTFESLGGMENIIDEINFKILIPFVYLKCQKYENPLLSPSTGILLYGPPGCGKTLLTKAIANELGCPLILFDFALIMDKWYGETEKLVKALFSLANRIQPCIIFIDEIDCLLQTRNQNDHEVTARIKSIFLTEMDGFISAHNNRILLIGATNRIEALDRAILRRFPIKYQISLPEAPQRRHILEILLDNIPKSNDLDLEAIAKHTTNFTGSDLKDLCRAAINQSIRKRLPSKLNLKDAQETLKTIYNENLDITLTQSDFLMPLSNHPQLQI